MSYSAKRNETLTEEEWNELVALKDAINENPATVHPEKMELFTELLVRSWDTETDAPNYKPWRTGSAMND